MGDGIQGHPRLLSVVPVDLTEILREIESIETNTENNTNEEKKS
jgi:hypothetical protein